MILFTCAVLPTAAVKIADENCWSAVPDVLTIPSMIELIWKISETCNDCVPVNGATTNCPFARRLSEFVKKVPESLMLLPAAGTVALIRVFTFSVSDVVFKVA